MGYASWSRHLPALVPALAAVIYLGLPQAEAEAAPPSGEGFNDGGGYITFTPGALVLTAERDFTDVNPSYGWALGGGYMFAPGSLFKGTIGVGFEHNVLMLAGYKFGDFGAHVLRVMPEARLGLGGDTVWGYGLIGAGFASTLWHWDLDLPFLEGLSGSRSAAGLNLQAGVGLQGFVYNNFFIGGEVDVDVGFFHEKDIVDWGKNDDRDFSLYQVSFELTLGWHF
ncbi:hypothetical protein ENSA5_23830 [Enhygromyxa salina]|uniref:Outer membrane protein beta-barrel domain-containing protein n=1 Tax=Enhygromyxa salina TaxID=215803 RepID=A0A2S9YBI2_9BACT|nr:hypothetical protein [Enhygromyxa salina]PRQ02366.1 hypothetical protein ENSA5_23830 [Enhygromyxa salina]